LPNHGISDLIGYCNDHAAEAETRAKRNEKTGAEYGDALVCVRYRYDEASRTRMKTIELVVEKRP